MKYIKVFGERNTGTNFLVELLDSNTNLRHLIHRDKTRNRAELNKLVSAYPRLKKSEISRKIILERITDAKREKDFLNNFGWKHAAINSDKMEKSDLFQDTLFLCLIRNPWRFISALHKRPYNYLPKAKKELRSFIQSPLITTTRDGLEESLLNTPVDLWNKKVASYQHFQRVHPERVMILYYEEIMNDIDHFLLELKPFCKVSKQTKIPISSTKKDKKTFNDYRREVQLYSPLESIGAKCTKLITKKLDKRIFNQTIYKKLSNFKDIC